LMNAATNLKCKQIFIISEQIYSHRILLVKKERKKEERSYKN